MTGILWLLATLGLVVVLGAGGAGGLLFVSRRARATSGNVHRAPPATSPASEAPLDADTLPDTSTDE